MNYEICSGAELYLNTEVAENLGMELDEEFVSGAAQVFEEIVVE